MTRHAAVGINDNFTTSQTAVTHWATDNETTGRVDEEFGGRSQPFSGQNWLDDLFHYRFLQRFLVDLFRVLSGKHDSIDTNDFAVVILKVTWLFASGAATAECRFYALQPDAVPDGVHR